MIKIAKRPNKIKTYNKKYSLVMSPFYRLTSQYILCQLLSISDAELLSLLEKKDNKYNCFFNENGRWIEDPQGLLKKVHNRIASLICRIETPEYLHSGVKKRSTLTNAAQHCNAINLLKIDIEKFYPSTTYDMVFSFFKKNLQCSKKISLILANLCTLENHIPTGSRLSMRLAFLVNKKMFDEMARLAQQLNVTMTLYVDDICFSGKNEVNDLLKSTVLKIIKRHGRTAKKEKTVLYKNSTAKMITGIVIKNKKVKIPNNQHKKLSDDFALLSADNDNTGKTTIFNRLLGRLHYMSSIEPNQLGKIQTLKKIAKT